MSAEQHVWHAVSTLHAGGRVHKGELADLDVTSSVVVGYLPTQLLALAVVSCMWTLRAHGFPAFSLRPGFETQRCRCAGSDPRWCWSEDEADVIVESAASGVHSAREISVKFEPRHLALR